MTNVTDLLPAKARPYAKFLMSLAVSVVGAVLLVVDPDQIPDWLQIVGLVLGVGGASYGTRNDTRPRSRLDDLYDNGGTLP